MKRHIEVTTDIYAAIWAARQKGENSENDILARILGCERDESNPEPSSGNGNNGGNGGVFDGRNNVHFPYGFEIFRFYKSKEYKTVAKNGMWIRRDTGEAYANLNQLNNSITKGSENVWNGNWKYKDEAGNIHSINDLRQ